MDNGDSVQLGIHLHMSGEIYGTYLKLSCLSPVMQGSGSTISEDDFPTRNKFLLNGAPFRSIT